MDTRWLLDGSKDPPLFFHGNLKSINIFVDVFLESESDGAGLGDSEKLELIHFGNLLSEILDSTDDALGRFFISILSKDLHCVPGTNNWGSAPGSGRGGSSVETTGPKGIAEITVVHQLSGIEHDHGDSLWSHSVLVVVAGNRGNSWNGEIEIGNISSELLGEWDDEASEATVNVESNSVLECNFSQGGNIISGSVGELRATSNKANGIAIYGLGDFLEINSHILINLDHSSLNIVVSAGLVEGDVGSYR